MDPRTVRRERPRARRKPWTPLIEGLERRRLLASDYRFATSFSGSSITPNAVATDADGTTYVTGEYVGTAVFPGAASPLTSAGGSDIYVAKYSPSGTLSWVRSYGGTGDDRATAIASDGNGHVYLTGSFSSVATFATSASPILLTSAGSTDAFIAKFDASQTGAGKAVWAYRVGTIGADQGGGIAVDASGNVALTGAASGVGVIGFASSAGGTSLSYFKGGTDDLFVAKYHDNGTGATLAWANAAYGTTSASGSGVAIDPFGRLIVTGTFAGKVYFPHTSYSVTSFGGSDDVFLAAFEGVAGAVQWAEAFGGVGPDHGAGVTTDPAGNIYFDGSFSGTADFDPRSTTYTLSSVGSDDAFVAKVAASGEYRWADRIGAAMSDRATGIAFVDGGPVITGTFQGVVDFDPQAGTYAMTSNGERDAFVEHFTSTGNMSWVRQVGGVSNDTLTAIAAKDWSHVAVVGNYLGSLTLKTGLTLTTAGSSNAIVAQIMGRRGAPQSDYDADGTSDPAVFDPTTATWSVKESTAGVVTQQFGAANLDIPVPGDYDGDGKTDFAVFRPSTATWYIQRSTLGAMILQFGAANLDWPIPADFDGDGVTDLAVYRPNTAEWFVQRSNRGAFYQQFGAANLDIPAPADYDGDGRADLAVYRPTTAEWYISRSTAGGFYAQFGAGNLDRAAPGDFDGDGKADIGVFRPTTAQWLVSQSTAGNALINTNSTLGTSNGQLPKPIVADFDGDGASDPTVFNRSAGSWAIVHSTNGSQEWFNFGVANRDIPLPPSLQTTNSGGGPSVGSMSLVVGGGALTALNGSGGDPDVNPPAAPNPIHMVFVKDATAPDQTQDGYVKIERVQTGQTPQTRPVLTVGFEVVTSGPDLLSAVLNVDFTLSPTSSVTIDADSDSALITIHPLIHETIYKYVTLSIKPWSSGTAYSILQADKSSDGDQHPERKTVKIETSPIDSTPGSNPGNQPPGSQPGDSGVSPPGTSPGDSTNVNPGTPGTPGSDGSQTPKNFDPHATLFVTDQADSYFTGEGPVGIDDGLIWGGISDGSVLVSPNRTGLTGSGLLPEWRSSMTGNPTVVVNWALPPESDTHKQIVGFAARLQFDAPYLQGSNEAMDWVNFTVDPTKFSYDDQIQFALKCTGGILKAGYWHTRVDLKVTYEDGSTGASNYPVNGQVIVASVATGPYGDGNTTFLGVNPFGAGWWIPGLDQLNFAHTSAYEGASWIRGDGSAVPLHHLSSGWALSVDIPYTITADSRGFYIHGPNGLLLHFDKAGLLRSRTEQNRYTTTYDYTEGNGNGAAWEISTITDPYGRVTTYTYANNHLATVTDFAGRTVDYTYELTDAATGTNVNRVKTIVFSDHTSTRPGLELDFGYTIPQNLNGDRISSITSKAIGGGAQDVSSRTSTLSYDGYGSLTKVADPNSFWALTPVNYASFGHVIVPGHGTAAYLDPNGSYSYIETDRFGYVTTWQDPLGRVTSYQRDANTGLVTQMTGPDPDGRTGPLTAPVTKYSYDAKGRMTQMTLPSPANTTVVRTWSYTDPTFGDKGWDTPSSYTDENGKTTTYKVDPNYGIVLESTDPLGRVTNYTYNSLGRLTDILGPSTGAAGRPETKIEYNSLTTRADGSVATDLPTKMTFADGSFETIVYDAYDRPLAVTDVRGNTTTFTYDDFDRPLTVTAPNTPGSGLPAPITSYQYNAFGELIAETAPDPDGSGPLTGPRTDYTYDTSGRLTTVTGPEPVSGGQRPVSSYTYNAMGQVTSVTDPLGHVTRSAYDAAGNLASAADAAGNETHLSYDGLGRLIAVTDAAGNIATYKYDERSRITVATDPRGARTSYTYDNVGNVLSETDMLGRTTSYAYDDGYRLTTVTQPDPDGTGPLHAPVTSISYDALNRPTQILGVAPVGAPGGAGSLPRPETDYTYGPFTSHQVTITYPSPDGNSQHAPVTTSTYDAAGNLIQFTDPMGRVTDYSYDALSRVTQVTQPDSGTGIREVDLYTYDNLSQLTAVDVTDTGRIASSLPAISHTSYTYDGLGRTTGVTDFRGTQTYAYDLAGNLASSTDPLGHTTTYAYDVLNRLVSVTQPAPASGGNPLTSKFAYDRLGQLVASTDPLGNVTSYAYNPDGELIASADPLRNTTVSTYDIVGNLTSVTDPLGNKTSYTYDALNQLTAVTDPTGHSTNYKYDDAGNLIQVTDRNGHTRQFVPDNLGRTTQERWLDASNNVINTINYTYNADDQLTHVGDANASYDFTYDGAGQNATTTATYNGITTPGANQVTFTNTFDSVGRLTNLADSRGGSIGYTYDSASRPTSAQMTVNGTASVGATFTYDNADRLTGITEKLGSSGPQLVTAFSYDNADRLTGITYKNGTNGPTLASWSYTLDADGRVTNGTGTNASGQSETRTYTYDAASQLKSEKVGTATPKTYGFDAAGNRTGTTVSTGNRITDDGTYTYTYDADGNEITKTRKSDGQVTTFDYDYRNRMTHAVVKTSTGTVTYEEWFTYDAFDRRIGDKVDADGNGTAQPVQTWTLYDGDNTYADLNSSGTITQRYLYGPAVDMLLARTDGSGGSAQWYLTDRLGSVRGIANASTNAVTSRVDYDAFGNPTTMPTGERFGYTAREWDTALGLWYNRARYYDPKAGRWTQEDPLGFGAGDPNLYRYVGNDATDATDPSGLEEQVINGTVVDPSVAPKGPPQRTGPGSRPTRGQRGPGASGTPNPTRRPNGGAPASSPGAYYNPFPLPGPTDSAWMGYLDPIPFVNLISTFVRAGRESERADILDAVLAASRKSELGDPVAEIYNRKIASGTVLSTADGATHFGGTNKQGAEQVEDVLLRRAPIYMAGVAVEIGGLVFGPEDVALLGAQYGMRFLKIGGRFRAYRAGREVAEKELKIIRAELHAAPAGLRPSNFGLRTIAEDPATLRMWNDAMRSAANSARPNGYTRYLQALERGGSITKSMMDEAFQAVNSRFLESYRSAGNQAYAVHHWNFDRNTFPNQVLDPRNLVPVPNRTVHETIHRATSSTTDIWGGPISPQYQIPIPDVSTPLAPR